MINLTKFYGVPVWAKNTLSSLTIFALILTSAGGLLTFPRVANAVDNQSCSEAATHTITSDTQTTFTGDDGSGSAVVVTPTAVTASAWTASIPGATWIWSTSAVTNPTVDNTETFTRTFTISGTPTGSASLDIAADNYYTVSVNGTQIGAENSDENNFQLLTQDSYSVTNLVSGVNTITVVGKNKGADLTAEQNPAGVLFKLSYTSDDCLKVHIYKYLDNGDTVAQVPDDSSAPAFPMTSTWNAANLGGAGGPANYILGDHHGGTAFKYAADTSPMSAPADYSTFEVTGGESPVIGPNDVCSAGKYQLLGYKSGDTLQAAEGASLSLTVPAFTGLSADKHIIVVNKKCPDTPVVVNSCPVPDALTDDTVEAIGTSAEQTLQQILNDESYGVDVTTDQKQYQVWNVTPGTSVVVDPIKFVDKFAGQNQVFGYYTNGDTSNFVPVFKTSNVSGYGATPLYSAGPFSVAVPVGATTLGFAMRSFSGDTLTGTFATENALNASSEDHVLVYNPSSNKYALAFEDLPLSGDHDYNDLVVEVTLACQVIPQFSTVTVCKVDAHQDALSGWTLSLAGEHVENLIVPSNTSAGIDSSSLTAGVSYIATATGTWLNQGGANPVDAEYSTTDSWATHMDGYTGYQTDILELQINSAFDPSSNWGAYNNTHTYTQSFVPGVTGPVNFRIFDGTGTTPDNAWYDDNSGTLSVNLSKGYAGITGENGCVVFNNVPYGTYTVGENPQDGWTNVSGLNSVTVDSAAEQYTVVNTNDEVVTLEPVCDANVNLLSNPGFETPTITHSALWDVFNAAATSWLTAWLNPSGAPSTALLELQKSGVVSGWTSTTGQWAELDSDFDGPDGSLSGASSVSISQDVPTIPGATYEVSFDFSARPGTDAAQNKIESLHNNTLGVTAGPTAGGGNLAWSSHNYTFVASGATTNVAFRDAGAPSDSLGSFIDNASVRCVLPPNTANVHATKIVCESEEYLPNWGTGSARPITAGTAAAFLAGVNLLNDEDEENDRAVCWLESGWKFEWAPEGTSNPGDNNEVGGGAWSASGLTALDGTVTLQVPVDGDYVWFREQLKAGYIGFTGQNTSQAESAEVYCHVDALNYDNYDRIDNPVAGETYYCVALNVEAKGALTINKVASNGTGTFTFSIGDDEDPVHITTLNLLDGGGSSGTATIELPAGTYDVTELVPEGWQLNNSYCTYDGDSEGSEIPYGEQITIEDGDTVTCTFNNSQYQQHTNPACSDGLDNDDDGLADANDPGCHLDNDPNNPNSYSPTSSTEVNNPENNERNGGGAGGADPQLFSNGGNGPFVLGASIGPSGSTGEVLGESCGLYMDRFVRLSFLNDSEQVKKLQEFLNRWVNAGLTVNGIFDAETELAVRAFQMTYFDEILKPWGLSEATGLVYLTTLRQINFLECPALGEPLPELVPWDL